MKFLILLIITNVYYSVSVLNIRQRTLLEKCHELQKDGGLEIDCAKIIKKSNNKMELIELDEIEEEVDENISRMLQLKEKIKKFRRNYLRGISPFDNLNRVDLNFEPNENYNGLDHVIQSVMKGETRNNMKGSNEKTTDEIDKQINLLNNFKINNAF